MEEIQIWSTFAAGRIGNTLGVIALILFGWLALRYAAAVRASEDGNIIFKVLGSVFALAGAWAGYNWSVESQNWYHGSANALAALKQGGAEVSGEATSWIAQYGGTNATSADPITIVFWVVVVVTVLLTLWAPKK
jgi:hypothetical protein